MASVNLVKPLDKDLLDKWFWNEIVFYRFGYAAVSYTAVFVVSSIWTNLLLQTSILHPIIFLRGAFALFTGAATISLTILVAISCLITIVTQYKLVSCSSKVMDWRRRFLWIIAYYVTNASADMLFVFVTILGMRTKLSFDERIIAYYTVFFTGSILSVEFFTLGEYVLKFPQYVRPKTQQVFIDGRQVAKRLLRVSWKQWLILLGLFFVAGHHLTHYSLQWLSIVRHTDTTTSLPVTHSFKVFTLVGLIWTSFVCFLSTTLRRKFSDRLLNTWLCQPYAFEVPSASVFPQNIESSDDSFLPTLDQAMSAETNEYVKYLAFWDLSRLTKLSKPRLHHLFQVSKPGGHPRPWMSIRDECLKLLNEFSTDLHSLNDKLARSWELAVSQKKYGSGEEFTSKFSVAAKNAASSLAYDQKIDDVSNWGYKEREKFGSLRMLEKLLHEKDIFQHYQLHSWIVESFGNIFCVALSEDRFGVVQRDLGPLLSHLCDLHAALERFGRLCGTQNLAPAKRRSLDSRRLFVKNSLTDALKGVCSAYGSHMKSIDLSEDHRHLISLL